MEILNTFISDDGGLPIVPIALVILAIGLATLVASAFMARSDRNVARRRLRVEADAKDDNGEPRQQKTGRKAVREKAVKTTLDFYSKGDPEVVARLRLKLIKAGYMEPGAVGTFFIIRFVAFVVFGLGAMAVTTTIGAESTATNRWVFIGMAAGFGYFLPGFVLSRVVAAKVSEYRNGFPDFMDLMIVCSDAGMSMEAGIERVSRELEMTYPTLSKHLQLLSIELRVGRNLEDSLRSLGDRLNLEEVRSFATLLRQSKELGTSLSGALRVFSDEMRHKRLSLAEEKAHALPAKLSIPVTACILPVVLMIAIIPVIVKFTTE